MARLSALAHPKIHRSRASFTGDAVMNARASTTATPYACAKARYALTNATMTSTDVLIASIVESSIAGLRDL